MVYVFGLSPFPRMPLWPPGWHEKCLGRFQSKHSWLPLLLGRRTAQGKLVQLTRYKFVDPTSRPSIFTIFTGSNTSLGQISTQNISSGSIGRTVVFINLSQWNGVLPKWSFLVGNPWLLGTTWYHHLRKPPNHQFDDLDMELFFKTHPDIPQQSVKLPRRWFDLFNMEIFSQPRRRFVYIYLHWSPYKYLKISHSCRWIPSRELTYPPKMAFWRWFSYSQGGIC